MAKVVGSGTVPVVERLTTRKPKLTLSNVGLLLSRLAEDRGKATLSQLPPREPRVNQPELFVRSPLVSSHSHTFPLMPTTP